MHTFTEMQHLPHQDTLRPLEFKVKLYPPSVIHLIATRQNQVRIEKILIIDSGNRITVPTYWVCRTVAFSCQDLMETSQSSFSIIRHFLANPGRMGRNHCISMLAESCQDLAENDEL